METHHHHEDRSTNFLISDQTWIIADTHFFHINIGRYCKRPGDWQARIIQNWTRLVGPNDIVFHLGDLALARKADVKELVEQLPGQIFMLRGNHDRFSRSFYQRLGISLVPDPYEILHPSSQKLVFSHRPILPLESNVLNLHGHIHNNPAPELCSQHVNLSIEVRVYRPWRLCDILEHFTIGKKKNSVQ
jgi:calcineurin-like phosphoesterase family protein